MALRERGRDKPARARMAEPDADVDDGPDLRTRIAATGIAVTDLQPTGPDRLEQAGWSELIDHVRTGHWSFAGGALWVDGPRHKLHGQHIDQGSRQHTDQGKIQGKASRQAGTELRSEEHTSELQSLMRISYAVFCL